jgi:hypothetical protein
MLMTCIDELADVVRSHTGADSPDSSVEQGLRCATVRGPLQAPLLSATRIFGR